MADVLKGIAPQIDTHTNWVTNNPTLGKDSDGKSYGQIIFSTDSPAGDIFIYGNNQTYSEAYAAGQFCTVEGILNAGTITNYTAGETMSAPLAVYVKNSDGKVYKGDNNNFDTAKIAGFIIENATQDNEVSVQASGILDGFTGLTVNEIYYLGENGNITTIGNIGINEVRIMVGIAISATKLLIILGEPTYIRASDSHNIGDIIWSANPSMGRLQGVLPFGSSPVSQSDFAELYAVIGDQFETAWTDLGYAASGAGMFYPAPPPQLFPRAAIPRVAVASTDFDDTNDRIDDGDSLTSGVAPFHIHRDGTAVRFSAGSGTLPAGITEGTVYYARKVNSDQSIELWTTEAAAIAGSGTQVTDFSGASGTVYMYNAGLRVADAIQIHEHDIRTDSADLPVSDTGGAQSGWQDVQIGSADVYTGPRLKARDIEEDSTESGGTPRTANETRPENILLYGYIKASHVGVTGEPVTAVRYDTGWVSNSDWTNAELTVSHNLGANLDDLIVELFLKDGSGNILQPTAVMYDKDNATAKQAGVSLYEVDTNTLKVQTGLDGLWYVQDSGTILDLDTETYDYKVVVYKPSVLASYTGSRNTIISISDATDQTVNIPPAASIDYPIFIKRVGTGDGKVLLSFESGEDETGVSQLEGDGGYIELISDGTDWYIKSYHDFGDNGSDQWWEKDGEGGMRQWGYKDLTQSGSTSAHTTVTFVKTFTEAPMVIASCARFLEHASVGGGNTPPITTEFEIYIQNTTNTSQNQTTRCEWIALGRWK